MKRSFLIVNAVAAFAVTSGLWCANLVSAQDVSGYTGEFQPITTRLGVPKGHREGQRRSRPAEKSMAKKKSPSMDDGWAKDSIAYPTGKISTSSLLIEKMYPRVVRLGKAYEYKIKATNLTSLNLQNVSITEIIPEGFQLVQATPSVTNQSGNQATWDIGSLDPNESVMITLRGQANTKEQLPCCTSADYANPALCSKSQVVSPAINVKLQAPAEVTACEKIPLEYTVKNSGDSTLKDVQISATLPKGTTNLSGGNSINLKVGSLAAGESKKQRVYALPQDAGTYSFTGDATSTDASASSNASSTRVVKPTISLSASVNREKIYIGRPLSYDLKISNNGQTTAEAINLMAKISSVGDIVSVSDGGRVSGNNASWNIGMLKPGASKMVKVNATGVIAGNARLQATAEGTCLAAVSDTAQSLVSGIPALLLEVVDVVDPIELNGDETYIVTVTNQGTADASNIIIKAMLEGMKYISDTGATRGAMSGNTLSFGALPTLAPKQKAQWNIKVSGAKTGDLRFRVTMDSDELTRSVEETESTYVY